MRDDYEMGYEDGESSQWADWDLALDGLLPENCESSPSHVAAYIRHLMRGRLGEPFVPPVPPNVTVIDLTDATWKYAIFTSATIYDG